MTAIWGDSRRNRCKEIVLSLFAPGHQVDPLQGLPYRRLVGLVRMAQRRPDVRALILKVRRLAGTRPPLGPVGLARDAFRQVGWRWDEPWNVVAGNTTIS